MKPDGSNKRIVLRIALSIVALSCFFHAGGQDQEDEERKLWDSAFRSKRPASSAAIPVKQPVYRLQKAAASAALPSGASSLIGITILKLRPAVERDSRAVRLLVHEGPSGSAGEWIPVRVQGGAPLREGERVRLSIEAPQKGYLYVVDREQYADGSLGSAYLVFPTLRTMGGKNEVRAGRIIEIPAWEDKPPFFRLERSRPDHVAEALTILVTPEPLPGVTISQSATLIGNDMLADWERNWSASCTRLELAESAGQAYSLAERQSAQDASKPLTTDKPMPQTIYCVFNKKGNPVLLQVILPITATGE